MEEGEAGRGEEGDEIRKKEDASLMDVHEVTERKIEANIEL
ncbi:hypothetical protein CCACVL1_12267 [Corchorus capsularis]|uniref:Uncharacterized protein n=1 Tax=Corchorus capsularis TaxID=210143 RepID=A0A1R3IGL4_COCAP|nr:hypothetical protein CCACVL1_12267 [Corchorus capsularis]